MDTYNVTFCCVITGALHNFSLGRPVVRNGLVIVGTDDLSANDNFLVCVNGETMFGDLKKDPIVSHINTEQVNLY